MPLKTLIFTPAKDRILSAGRHVHSFPIAVQQRPVGWEPAAPGGARAAPGECLSSAPGESTAEQARPAGAEDLSVTSYSSKVCALGTRSKLTYIAAANLVLVWSRFWF